MWGLGVKSSSYWNLLIFGNLIFVNNCVFDCISFWSIFRKLALREKSFQKNLSTQFFRLWEDILCWCCQSFLLIRTSRRNFKRNSKMSDFEQNETGRCCQNFILTAHRYNRGKKLFRKKSFLEFSWGCQNCIPPVQKNNTLRKNCSVHMCGYSTLKLPTVSGFSYFHKLLFHLYRDSWIQTSNIWKLGKSRFLPPNSLSLIN